MTNNPIEDMKNLETIKKNIDVQIELRSIEFINIEKDKLRKIDTIKKMIEYYKYMLNNEENALGVLRQNYESEILNLAQDVEWRETKTMLKYELPSVDLVYTKESEDMKLKDDYNDAEIPDEYINVKRYVNWQKLKSQCAIVSGTVVFNKTGEIMNGIDIVKKPAKFQVKGKR